MTPHLLFSVLINSSGKLSQIASLGNQATKSFNSLLNNFIQVVKINEDFVGDISKRSAKRLHSTAPIAAALMLKEIHRGGLMMLEFFSLTVLFKICMACFGRFQ